MLFFKDEKPENPPKNLWSKRKTNNKLCPYGVNTRNINSTLAISEVSQGVKNTITL